MESVNMTTPKYRNKVQEYAARVGIENQSQFRAAMKDAGASSSIARLIWFAGPSRNQQYSVLVALSRVLQIPIEKLLSD